MARGGRRSGLNHHQLAPLLEAMGGCRCAMISLLKAYPIKSAVYREAGALAQQLDDLALLLTGEREFFKRFDDLVDWHTMGEGFTWDTQDRARDIAAAAKAWEASLAMLTSGDYDLVVLDELNIVLRYDYLPADAVAAGLASRHRRTSVIVTGRDAKPEIVADADLVTEMTQVRHPFEAGIKAKQGIDF